MEENKDVIMLPFDTDREEFVRHFNKQGTLMGFYSLNKFDVPVYGDDGDFAVVYSGDYYRISWPSKRIKILPEQPKCEYPLWINRKD